VLNNQIDVTGLLGDSNYYGSNAILGNLSVTIDSVTGWSNYSRILDLNNGLHITAYAANGGDIYTAIMYCSYLDQVCVYNLSSSAALPTIIIKLQNLLLDISLVNSTCGHNLVHLAGITQLGPPTGMKFEAMARLATHTVTAYCSNITAGALVISADSHIRTMSLVIGARTNYDQTKGNAASNFAFKGADPGPYVEIVTSSAAARAESDIRLAHMKDYKSPVTVFSLELSDPAGSAVLRPLLSSVGTTIPQLVTLIWSLSYLHMQGIYSFPLPGKIPCHPIYKEGRLPSFSQRGVQITTRTSTSR
jgi:alpha-L-fucosidase 2